MIYWVTVITVRVSVAYNFQTGNKIKLVMECESVAQKCYYLQNQYCGMLSNSSMHAFCGVYDVQHLWCKCFSCNSNSELQFIEGGHKGPVNNVLNVAPQEEIKWCNSG